MDKRWDTFIFFTVIVVLIMLVIELTFDISESKKLFIAFEWAVFMIFAIDLNILYKRAESFKEFFKKSWLDIIATIPFALIATVPYGIMFRSAKILRLIKIFKSMKIMKALETMRFVHVDRILKIFSKEERNQNILEENQKK